MTRQEKELETILSPVVESLGYMLYDIEYVKEGQEYFVRLYIDSDKGIDLDDCEKVSNAVGEKLDDVDPIETSYNLEVSSCGLERRLREKKHFEMAVSKRIEVKLFKAVENKKVFTGVLKSVSDSDITILLDEENEKKKSKNKDIKINDALKEQKIEMENIAGAKILYNWEE